MESYLVFHVYGPLFAAGDTAVGEYRPSFSYPTKSGILGLVAGAMGIRREEDARLAELAEAVSFSVLVFAPGRILRDFHTVQFPSSRTGQYQFTRREELLRDGLNTIVSTRDYRQDVLFRVALTSKDKGLLERIREALERPRFAPYLGRKSCPPALPFCPQLIKAASIVDAMKKTTWTEEQKELLEPLLSSSNSQLQLFTEEKPEGAGFSTLYRRDRLMHRGNWQFGERREYQLAMEVSDVLQ